MALDQQRNWTVSMAENLEKVIRSNGGDGKSQRQEYPQYSTTDPTISAKGYDTHTGTWTTSPIYLPDEIIVEILEYLSHSRHTSQHTLASCCLLSHQWYAVAVPLLYERPYLYGMNYDPFVRTICPSINLHIRKNPFAYMVKSLNMANLVHQGSKSWTARLLGRTKHNLEEFVAPQASFAMNCFAALSKCRRLRVLDLSLVSESPPLPELFKTVARLEELVTFRLPRSSGFGHDVKSETIVWPPNLENLCLSGGVDAHFVTGIVRFPESLRSLTIEHCPLAKASAIMYLLRSVARGLPRLKSLKLAHFPRVDKSALDLVLCTLPNLRRLSISVDYITPEVFDLGMARAFNEEDLQLLTPPPDENFPPVREFQLRTLELTNSGNPGVDADKISPIDVMIAMDEGVLPHLRQVRVAKSLGWHGAAETESLVDALSEAKTRAGIGGEDEGLETGVWTFDG